MEVTTKELRIQPGKIIDQVSSGQEITITYRGKPLARIVPFAAKADSGSTETIFGLWKNAAGIEDVDAYVRDIRKGRGF
ncbi:MAG TPA: type II toxin-antitoxin system prevent-host-death family antitoxin [Spirochaetales bacterium]|nr:type II toxin-antitoxin system prevent-host-death family antitoxin [Spirochaetales bacterium]